MEFLQHLWLPIIVSGVAVFMCSFLVWAILPHHKKDWAKLPDEDGVRNDLKARGLSPGVYMFPMLKGNECNTPEGKEKFDRAPAGSLTVYTKPNMGKNMFCTFVVFLIASFLIGYVAWHTRASFPGDFGDRFQVLGSIGILTYCFSFLPNMIWFQAGKRAMVNGIIDGVFYGLVTGAIFSWLWPTASLALKL